MTKADFYQIIANADDFGRHAYINRAVQEAFAKGCLKSATIMPGGKAFADAIEIVKNNPGLGLGIHLTLVNGYPILPPAEIPSLVNKEGFFLDDYMQFVKRFFAGKIKLAEVQRELTAQVDKVMATGVSPSHIDSHQHLHTLPGIIDIALELAKGAHISAVRIPQTPLFTGFTGNPVQLGGRLGLYTMATLARRKAKAQGFRCPEHFAGIVAGEAVSTKHLLDIIQGLKPGTTEIMVHPGTDNKILQGACQWNHDFEAELAALTNLQILELLAQKHVKIGNYTNL